tara:strand:- start:1459 stop:2298 length:840 start_codon:yes stop_codon:yes gene_type:complete
MANYAIGDIQGCYFELMGLLDLINFDESKDKLWFTGDLINRGPESLKTLDFLFGIRDNCNIVLGNHDLHFLALAEKVRKPFKKDTLNKLLQSPFQVRYIEWLKSFNLMYYQNIECEKGNKTFLMTHAGIPPHWSFEDCLSANQEIKETMYDDKLWNEFLKNMYGNYPNKQEANLTKLERMRLNTNYFTRMRFCTIDGELELEAKGPASNNPDGFKAWFKHPLKIKKENLSLIFGHWAALGGITNVPEIIAVDTGCVWGYKLSAYRLEDDQIFSYDQIKK